MQTSPINRIALYVRDLDKVSAWYEKHFGFRPVRVAADKVVLFPALGSGGCALVLLQASRGHKIGQSSVKLVFDVRDVQAFREERLKRGLKFGFIHKGLGYEFANARDPAKNLIQISNAYLTEIDVGTAPAK